MAVRLASRQLPFVTSSLTALRRLAGIVRLEESRVATSVGGRSARRFQHALGRIGFGHEEIALIRPQM